METFERNATRYICKLSKTLSRRLDAISAYEELTGGQGKIVRFMLTLDGPIHQKDIEKEYSIRASSATELLNQIEAKGYIVRREDPDNHRQKLIYLTDKALGIQSLVTKSIIGLDDELVSGVDKKDLEVCLNALEIMLQNMEKY